MFGHCNLPSSVHNVSPKNDYIFTVLFKQLIRRNATNLIKIGQWQRSRSPTNYEKHIIGHNSWTDRLGTRDWHQNVYNSLPHNVGWLYLTLVLWPFQALEVEHF